MKNNIYMLKPEMQLTQSLASSSPALAWSLLTPEQQTMLVHYIEKAHEWESVCRPKEQADRRSKKLAG
jgi:hypothetical protein